MISSLDMTCVVHTLTLSFVVFLTICEGKDLPINYTLALRDKVATWGNDTKHREKRDAECTNTDDCPIDTLCRLGLCTNPCLLTYCGEKVCEVIDHSPECNCPSGYISSGLKTCKENETTSLPNPAKYKNPCPANSCSFRAECYLDNNGPVCKCPKGLIGNPFLECVDIPQGPCEPSPCGPNSKCTTVNMKAVCSCLPNYVGSPPSCRLECVLSSECDMSKACINSKCVDPCPGACGLRAECDVVNHVPVCRCPMGLTGNPFSGCVEADPCESIDCGPYSRCTKVNTVAECSCLPYFLGYPPSCRPQCIVNSECDMSKACINQKCSNPCVGACGFRAYCTVQNHGPICTCPIGLIGNPFTYCYDIPQDSCEPSPCGPNSKCTTVNMKAVCSCLPNYGGSPPSCRIECVLSSDCDMSKACINTKCVDPCPGSCGLRAECYVVNHAPICRCPMGLTGNPFSGCVEINLEPLNNAYGLNNYESGMMRIAFARGNPGLAKKLYGGPVLSDTEPFRSKLLKEKIGIDNWHNDFHSYTMVWRPDGIDLLVNGEPYGTVNPGGGFFEIAKQHDVPYASYWQKGTIMAPLDQMFHLTLGLRVGGINDFDDNLKDKPWRNSAHKARLDFWKNKDSWYPSWYDGALKVDFVRVYAL